MAKAYDSRPLGLCTACFKKPADQWHHKFHRTKWALKLYGAALMDARGNLQAACSDCHAGHLSPNLIHWSESQFCQALGIEPRSKIGRMHAEKV